MMMIPLMIRCEVLIIFLTLIFTSQTQKIKDLNPDMTEDTVMPFIGPVKGVKMYDYEKIDFFSDRTIGSGTLEGTCTLTSCDGINMFESIQSDLSYWRDRGGISAQDLNAAMTASKDLVRITILNGKLYARNYGKGVFTYIIILLLIYIGKRCVPYK